MRYRSFVYDTARWEGFRLRGGDVVIATPPKCGTTWTQNIVGMLLLGTADLGRPISEVSPWLDQVTRPLDQVVAGLEAQDHRRFIKTHSPLDGLPWDDDVTYVCVLRDPRDVAVSWDHHFHNVDRVRLFELRGAAHGFDDLAELPPPREPSEDPAERWWAFMTTRAPSPEFVHSLELVVRHAVLAWERRFDPNVVLVHYADLQQDLPGEVRRIAKRLGVEASEGFLDEVTAAATFASMRERADAVVPNAGEIWIDQTDFFHRGTSGQWVEVVGEEADARYQGIVRELCQDEELLSWLHRP